LEENEWDQKEYKSTGEALEKDQYRKELLERSARENDKVQRSLISIKMKMKRDKRTKMLKEGMANLEDNEAKDIIGTIEEYVLNETKYKTRKE